MNASLPPLVDDRPFAKRKAALEQVHADLLARRNTPEPLGNGIFQRWAHPVITAAHAPLSWRYDFDEKANPFLMERMGINAAFNAGAIFYQGKHIVALRMEGADRKSFFALAESPNGIDSFRFHDTPIDLPQAARPDVNVYDMRLTAHEDGWIYGLFCSERKDESRPEDTTAAIAACGIVRTKDLKTWERLPDLQTPSPQQRNVVLHPEFVNGQYALYTRPQDGFISVGGGGGIGWALCDSMENPVVEAETVLDGKEYHTIKEMKNGQGPAPLKTRSGWLHMAHGVRNTAAGLRYVLYMFVTDPDDATKVIRRPGGYVLAPEGEERVGDVSNVLFSNGWTVDDAENVFLYYASSDTRLHVATSTVDRLIDYCFHTPEDPLTSAGSVSQRLAMIERNRQYLQDKG